MLFPRQHFISNYTKVQKVKVHSIQLLIAIIAKYTVGG